MCSEVLPPPPRLLRTLRAGSEALEGEDSTFLTRSSNVLSLVEDLRIESPPPPPIFDPPAGGDWPVTAAAATAPAWSGVLVGDRLLLVGFQTGSLSMSADMSNNSCGRLAAAAAGVDDAAAADSSLTPTSDAAAAGGSGMGAVAVSSGGLAAVAAAADETVAGGEGNDDGGVCCGVLAVAAMVGAAAFAVDAATDVEVADADVAADVGASVEEDVLLSSFLPAPVYPGNFSAGVAEGTEGIAASAIEPCCMWDPPPPLGD